MQCIAVVCIYYTITQKCTHIVFSEIHYTVGSETLSIYFVEKRLQVLDKCNDLCIYSNEMHTLTLH